jgi:RNA polymerase sigma-70 factor (ECF subfamily)
MLFAIISEGYTNILIKKAAKGNEDAFCSLIREIEPLVFNLAYNLLGNRQDAEDMSQEAFLRVYKALPNYRGEASFKNWAMRICKNVCMDEMRRRKVRIQPVGDVPETLADNTDITSQILEDERKQALRTAIDSLDERARTLVIMRDINLMSYKQIAEVMDLEIGTVKSALNRARKKLREIIEEQNLL